MDNPFKSLGVPLEKEEDKEKEQSIKASSSSLDSNNPFKNLGTEAELPDEIRLMQFGASEETYLLGDAIRLSKAGIQSIFSNKSFSEEREEEEQIRLKELYEKYP